MILLDWICPNKLINNNLSKNPNAISFLKENPHKIDWYYISENPEAIDIIKANLDKISWFLLSINKNKINWEMLCLNPKRIFRMIEEYGEDIIYDIYLDD